MVLTPIKAPLKKVSISGLLKYINISGPPKKDKRQKREDKINPKKIYTEKVKLLQKSSA